MCKVRRRDFLCSALETMGVPYLWGGKDPARGLDCSGVVTYSYWLNAGPDWRWTHNCQKLWDELKPVTEPEPGDLALYGRDGRATHVMVYLGALGIVFGASDGDSTTTTTKEAKRRDAEVETRTSHLYRKDFIGWRRLPFAEENT